jgi:hypothetical protein
MPLYNNNNNNNNNNNINVHTGFWWGDPREGDHLGDPGVDGRII